MFPNYTRTSQQGEMTRMRILILGGSGRVGTMLRRCWEYDAQHTCLNDIELAFQTRQADPASPDDLLWDILADPPEQLSAAGPFDCMIVLSGIVPQPKADLRLNIAIGSAVIAAAAKVGIPRVLLASTSAVYGTYSNAPFAETDRLEPTTDYGRAKRKMEEVSSTRAQVSGVAVCCLRIGNVAGADALLLNGAALGPGKALQLDCFTNGGTPVRSYIGPHSLSRVLLSLARARATLPNALNIAAPHPVSMRALANAAQIPFVLHPTQMHAHQHVTLDCGALAAFHNFGPDCADPAQIIDQWRACRT